MSASTLDPVAPAQFLTVTQMARLLEYKRANSRWIAAEASGLHPEALAAVQWAVSSGRMSDA